MPINYIIHQIWIQGWNNIPKKYLANIERWKQFHRHFIYMFWDDRHIRKLIQNYYPYLLKKYDAHREPIFKADIGRIVILDYFGGIYVDLNIKCIKCIDKVIDMTSKYVYLPYEPVYFSIIPLRKFFMKYPTNSCLIGPARHGFWREFLYDIIMDRTINNTKYTESMNIKKIMNKRRDVQMLSKNFFILRGQNIGENTVGYYIRDNKELSKRLKKPFAIGTFGCISFGIIIFIIIRCIKKM